MLDIQHLTRRYQNKLAVSDLSLTFETGKTYALLGPNGSGKTTLMKCILGLLPHQGSVTLDGAPITEKNIERLSFATCEHSFFPALSPKAHRDFYQAHFPRFNEKRFQALMDFFELPMEKPLRAFSAGMKNQFEVVMALSQGADYILMDEPFAGNDVFNREDFYKVLLGILEEHETVLLSTHLLEEVQSFISRAVLLRKGELVGDCTIDELEEQGKDLMTYVKETYQYQSDRVSRVLCDVNGEEE